MSCSGLRFVPVLALSLMIPVSVVGQSTSRTMSMPRTVHGQVRFAHGGGPAERVIVRLERFHGGVWAEVVTDTTGKYDFSGMTPDLYVITVHLAGYTEQRREVDLESTNSAYELFQLVADKRSSPAPANSSGTSPRTASVVNANVPASAQKEFENAQAMLADKKAENDEAAVTILERLINVYPRFMEAQLALGAAYMDLKQWDKAEAVLQRILEIDPKVANAYFALGEIYLRQKKYELAEKTLTDGLALESRSAQSHLTLARVYWEATAGLKDEAARKAALEHSYAEVNQALQLNPNSADAHLLKGNLYIRAQRAADALHEFQAYLRLTPNGPYAEQARILSERIRKALDQKTPR
jgi:regulator of sirC expression with transglutaminase-like and TPR domain